MIHYDISKLKKGKYSRDDLIEIIDRLQCENLRISRRKKIAEDEAWDYEGSLLLACEKLEEYAKETIHNVDN